MATVKHNPVAKNLHKANNRACFHEKKRDKLISDTLDRESEESLILYEESTGFGVEYESDYELPCIGCSSLTVED